MTHAHPRYSTVSFRKCEDSSRPKIPSRVLLVGLVTLVLQFGTGSGSVAGDSARHFYFLFSRAVSICLFLHCYHYELVPRHSPSTAVIVLFVTQIRPLFNSLAYYSIVLFSLSVSQR